MSRIQPGQKATLAADVAYFVSPDDENVEDSEEVALASLLEPYQPSAVHTARWLKVS